MQQRINRKILDFEDDYDVTVVLASHFSSEGFGYPDRNQKPEVFFIYAYEAEKYLSVTNPDIEETFNFEFEDIWFFGLELRYALRLLVESDFHLYKGVRSSIFYRNLWDISTSFLQLFLHSLDCVKFYNSGISNMREIKGPLLKNEPLDLRVFLDDLHIYLMTTYYPNCGRLPPGDIFSLVESIKEVSYKERLKILTETLAEYGSIPYYPDELDASFVNHLSSGVWHVEVHSPKLPVGVNELFLEVLGI